jgi:hypothetical protein
MAEDEKTGTEIWAADEDVREMANDVIAHHHPHLADANFVFLMRSPTAKSKGKAVLGTAKKATPEHKALYLGEVDFIVTLAGAEWKDMTNRARRALLDHELCHCVGDSMKGWSMRGHDVEEFSEIIERHGLWHDELKELGETMRQLELDLYGQTRDRLVDAALGNTSKGAAALDGSDVTPAPRSAVGEAIERTRVAGRRRKASLTLVGDAAERAAQDLLS